MNRISFFAFTFFALGLLSACGGGQDSAGKDSGSGETANADSAHGHSNGSHKEHHADGQGHHKHDANAYMNQSEFEALIARFEDPERAAWQKPELVISRLGDVKDKIIADIGAGSGYFTIRIAMKGAHVIAGDIDERFLMHIRGRRLEVPVDSGGRVEVRLFKQEKANLGLEEVDHALIVNTYHHLADRVAYMKELRTMIKAGGKVLIVDFKTGAQPMGPPPEYKIPPQQILKELAAAGFTSFELDSTSLDYQFMIEAFF